MGSESISTGDVGVPLVGAPIAAYLATKLDPDLGQPWPPCDPNPPILLYESGTGASPGLEQTGTVGYMAAGGEVAATQVATSASAFSLLGGFFGDIAIATAAA